MKFRRDKEEEKIRKKIEKAEKKALKISGVDHGLIQRFWEIVSLFPKISDSHLEARVERFILNATPEEYYRMQKVLFTESVPYLLEDDRVRRVMEELSGKSIGLSVKGVYDSTVTLEGKQFKIERGIRGDIPVISVITRRDYADAILKKKDPIRMIISRKIRATHKLTLLKWALPHLDLFREKGLFEKYLSYQPEVEKLLDENLADMGY